MCSKIFAGRKLNSGGPRVAFHWPTKSHLRKSLLLWEGIVSSARIKLNWCCILLLRIVTAQRTSTSWFKMKRLGILSTLYPAHTVLCPLSTLPTLESAHPVFYPPCTLSTLYSAQSVLCPPCILPTLHSAHPVF